MTGTSQVMQDLFSMIRKISTTDAPVLIIGESGTGKELVARAIHRQGLRKDGPFIPINCSAIPENLIESELFGHEKGAFTGAVARRIGHFEEADGGTLLLGGHKITAEVDKEVGVPVLSKIPLVGRLFSNRSTIRDNKILLILVKPTIILQEEREADALAALEAGIVDEFRY